MMEEAALVTEQINWKKGPKLSFQTAMHGRLLKYRWEETLIEYLPSETLPKDSESQSRLSPRTKKEWPSTSKDFPLPFCLFATNREYNSRNDEERKAELLTWVNIWLPFNRVNENVFSFSTSAAVLKFLGMHSNSKILIIWANQLREWSKSK